jgi:hypothetical protein
MKKFTHQFVEFMPEPLAPEIIYISTRFSLVSHLCACGCGEEVVTPLSPTDWHLIFDGEAVSLFPSIGNWRLKCQSHYWITRNMVHWAPKWEAKITAEKYQHIVTGPKSIEESVSSIEPKGLRLKVKKKALRKKA